MQARQEEGTAFNRDASCLLTLPKLRLANFSLERLLCTLRNNLTLLHELRYVPIIGRCVNDKKLNMSAMVYTTKVYILKEGRDKIFPLGYDYLILLCSQSKHYLLKM